MSFLKKMKKTLMITMAAALAAGLMTVCPGVALAFQENESIEVLGENGSVREKKVTLKGGGDDQVTILVYMNGSDLESESGEATEDLTEMIKAGSSDRVNVIVQTMGTKSWNKKYGIASDRSQIYKVNGDGLTLLRDDLGQLDCTDSATLENFVKWGASTYPADRYILLFWNHGGGPVYGFGYDEWNSDEEACLSVDEMQEALRGAGVFFDFIGMDCCIMSSMEVCCALYDFCDYAILSEDFESGLGWSYTEWMKELYADSSIATTELGKLICDTMVSANEENKQDGDSSIMALVDQSMMKVLYTAWTEFAYANEDTLLGTNYSKAVKRKRGGKVQPALERGFFTDIAESWFNEWGEEQDVTMADYYITDIMAVAQNIASDETDALASAVANALVYVRASEEDASLTGLSVTLPYGDKSFYTTLKKVFSNIGLDESYISWLQAFAGIKNSVESYDYDDWSESWDGWESYDDDYDWEDWSYAEDETYWDDGFAWDDFDYDDSYNQWFYDYYADEYGDDWYDSWYEDYDENAEWDDDGRYGDTWEDWEGDWFYGEQDDFWGSFWGSFWDDDEWEDDDRWDDDRWDGDDWEDDDWDDAPWSGWGRR